MFRWQPQMIRYMKDASEYGFYHRKLAEKIVKHLPENANICDAGCGLGYLSLELAQYCHNVIAVDIAPKALNILSQNIQQHGYTNISVVEGNISDCCPLEPYDAMVFCFFGSIAKTLAVAKAQCCGRVIMIRKNWEKHRFTLCDKPLEYFNFAEAQTQLNFIGIPFCYETFALEMGQPFRSMEDAVDFFRTYNKDVDADSITATDIWDKLIKQDCKDFPYYLPSLKQMGLIALDSGDIPDDIQKYIMVEGEKK